MSEASPARFFQSGFTFPMVLGLLAGVFLGCSGGEPKPPSFSIDPAQGSYPLKVQVTSNVDQATSTRWDFGDGSPAVEGSPVFHIYWGPGKYVISFQARTASGSTVTSETTVEAVDSAPDQYSALYSEFAGKLHSADVAVQAKWDGALGEVAFSGWLIPANANGGASLLDNTDHWSPDQIYWKMTLRYLDGLKSLGAKAAVASANYPLLSPEFYPLVISPTLTIASPEPFIQYYEKLGEEVHQRGMIYVVEHNSLLKESAALPVVPYYDALKNNVPNSNNEKGVFRWSMERYREAVTILQRIKPDYLVLIEEPTTSDSDLGLPVSTWKTHVQGTAIGLRNDVPGSTALLGAGSGVWEDQEFIIGFAGMPELDFVEQHMYPLASPTADYFPQLLFRLDSIKSIDPSKKIICVEGWLYKSSAKDLGSGPPVNIDLFALDVYSFWAPLDSRFLEVMAKIAHAYNFHIMGPAWSRYFFAYLVYGDISLNGLSSPEILTRENQATLQAIFDGESTDTGEVFLQLSQGQGYSR